MITIVGMFAKARTYVVQTRPYNRRRRNPDLDWTHAAQFNYDGQMQVIKNGKPKFVRAGPTKQQAELSAHKFIAGLPATIEYRILNMTVKQAHKAKTANYRATGEIRKLTPEFDYDKKCRHHPVIPHTPKRKLRDERLGATALANPIRNTEEKNTKAWERLRKAMAYYEFAQNY